MVVHTDLVVELQGVRAGVTLLGRDAFNVLTACEQEGRDRRRHDADNVRNLIVSDDAWSAWHRRDKPQCGSTGINGDPRLLGALRATDLHPRRHDTSHDHTVVTATR